MELYLRWAPQARLHGKYKTGPRTLTQHELTQQFYGTITPTILYGSATWTLTIELENRIRKTQRQMLRMIIGTPRRRSNTTENPNTKHTTISEQKTHNDTNEQEQASDSNTSDANSETPQLTIPQQGTQDDEHIEPWPDFIRRCTREAEALLEKLKIDDWITQHKRQKWHLARDVTTRDKHKWSYQAISWMPTLQPEHNARRAQSRPRKRWADDIMHFKV